MSRRWMVALVVAGLTLLAGSGWGMPEPCRPKPCKLEPCRPGTCKPEPCINWTAIIHDPDGGPLPNAVVTLTPEEGEQVFTGITDTEGGTEEGKEEGTESTEVTAKFCVPPGRYRVKASHEKYTGAEGSFPISASGPSSATLQLESPVAEVAPYWNSWTLDSSDQPAATRILFAHSTYVIHFDLAGLDYRQIIEEPNLTARLGPAFQHELSSLGESLPLLYKPFVQGNAVRLAADAPIVDRQAVEMEPLFTTVDQLKTLSPRDNPRVADLSDHFSAFHVAVTIETGSPGQGIVGLALWDAKTWEPLDFVVFEVTVVPRGTHREVGPASIQSQSGFRTLRGSPSAPRAHAALSIFEHGNPGDGSLSNTVFFLGPNGEARYWSPRRSIREYVSLEGQFGLVRQLELAQCSEEFEQIGNFFSGVVFSAPDPSGLQAARWAQDELDRLITAGLGESWPRRPVVSTLFYNIFSGALPMPLGLLGVNDQLTGFVPHSHRLGEVATVTQPLPIPRRVEKHAPCIDLVTTVLPTTLGLGDHCECKPLDELLAPLVTPDPRYLIQKIEGLKDYLEKPYAYREPEGLLLIGHHADGFLSLDPSFRPALQAENVAREYSRGSAAILVGCTVGSLNPLNRSLPFLSALNEHGVDAMIFSPFTVDVALGSRLAVHFSAEIEKVRCARHPQMFTLRELYHRVLESLKKDEDAKPFLAQLSELSLAGSSDIRLCPALRPKEECAAPTVPYEPPSRCTCTLGDRFAQGLRRPLNWILGGPPGSISTSGPVKSDMGPGERAAVKRCRESVPPPQ